MKSFIQILFGTSWRSSLVGYIGFFAIQTAQYLQAIPADQGVGWQIAAFIILALGRLAKDASVTGGTVASTPEAAKRIEG